MVDKDASQARTYRLDALPHLALQLQALERIEGGHCRPNYRKHVHSYGISMATFKHFNGRYANALPSALLLQPNELPGETFSHAQS